MSKSQANESDVLMNIENAKKRAKGSLFPSFSLSLARRTSDCNIAKLRKSRPRLRAAFNIHVGDVILKRLRLAATKGEQHLLLRVSRALK